MKLQSGLFIASLYMVSSAFAANETEIFVKWRSGSTREHGQLTSHLGLKKVWQSSLVNGLERFEIDDFGDSANIYRALEQSPQVIYAEPNFKIHRIVPVLESRATPSVFIDILSPNDPMFSQQWAMTAATGVHAVEAWPITRGSRDIKVAVIDTGIDPTHPELSDRILPGYDFISNTSIMHDGHGHGTHVSGIIGAASNNGVGIAGINPEVSIIPIRAVPNNDDETDSNVISAFEFAAAQGARVANCSFGKEASSQAVGDTIEAVGQKGVLVVVAAGNDGQDNNQHNAFPANFRTSNMIVVASIAQSGNLSYFSDYGLTKVDIAAPGSNILSTIPGAKYDSWSGTSMATPQVVGVAALTLSANPAMTVTQLKDILLQTAVKLPSLIGKVDTEGRVDAFGAVNAAHNLLVAPVNP